MLKKQKIQPKDFVFQQLVKLKNLYCMSEFPDANYLIDLCAELHTNKWTSRQLFFVINHLKTSQEYAQEAKYNRYPSFALLEKTRKELLFGQRDIQFRSMLTSYLSGSWWVKEDLLNWCNGVELKALELAGGLQELYRRANDQRFPTDISRLLSEVAGHKATLPDEIEIADLPQMIENNQPLQITEEKDERAKFTLD